MPITSVTQSVPLAICHAANPTQSFVTNGVFEPSAQTLFLELCVKMPLVRCTMTPWAHRVRAEQPPIAPVWVPQPDDAIALALALRCDGRAPVLAARLGGPAQPCSLHTLLWTHLLCQH